VIKDVGATKGFLICTSGFAKSNHKYARTLGIELLTVEDIESDRWHADIKVPLIYIKKTINYVLDATIVANEELVAKNQTQAIPVNLDIDVAIISYDLGTTSTTIKEHVQSWIAKAGSFLRDVVEIDLVRPGLRLQVADTWLACEDLRIKLTIDRKYYLKYLTPAEYSQVRDHRRDITLPLHLKLSGPGQLNESFIQIPRPIFRSNHSCLLRSKNGPTLSEHRVRVNPPEPSQPLVRHGCRRSLTRLTVLDADRTPQH
jgi:hypothetical protein